MRAPPNGAQSLTTVFRFMKAPFKVRIPFEGVSKPIPDPKPILAFILEEELPVPVLEGLVNIFRNRSDFESVRGAKLNVCQPGLATAGRGVIFLVLTQGKQLATLGREIVDIRRDIPDTLSPLLVLNLVEHPKIPSLLRKLGVTEVFSATIRRRGLELRIERYLAAVESRWSKHVDSRAARKPREKQDWKIIEEPSLVVREDCWLVSHQSKISKFSNIWMIKIIGPSRFVGKWIKKGPLDTEGEGEWEWEVFNSLDKTFGTEGKAWRFFGKKPEFVELKWNFMGKMPQLALWQGLEELAQRFYCLEPSTLHIAQNSYHAKSKTAEISASFEKNLYLTQNMDLGSDPPAVYFEKDAVDTIPGKSDLEFETPQFNWNNQLEPTQVEPGKLVFFEKAVQLLASQSELFHLLTDPVVREGHLREAGEQFCDGVFWSRGQKLRINIKVDKFEVESGRITLHSTDDSDMQSVLDQLGANVLTRYFLNFNDRRAAVFFPIEVNAIQTEGGEISVPVPEEVYEVQRRDYLRFNIPAEMDLGLVLKSGEVDLYPALQNLSAGGFGALCSPSGGLSLKKGTAISEVQLSIGERIIRCSAIIRYIKKLNADSDSVRLGLQFSKIDEKDRQTIGLFVLEESYEYLQRYLPV